MPCVFPILAMKALHLARAGGEEREARRDALGLCGRRGRRHRRARARLLLAIRAGGSAAGWAFQLQDPRTILAAAAARHRDHAQPAAGCSSFRRSAGEATSGRQLRHRRARGVRRDPCVGPVHGRGARRGAAASLVGIGAGLRRPRARAGAAVRRGRLRARAPRADCPSPGRGWRGSSASSRCRWRRPRSAACGCCIARAGPAGSGRPCRGADHGLILIAVGWLQRKAHAGVADRRLRRRSALRRSALAAASGGAQREAARAGRGRALERRRRCQRRRRRAGRCSSISPPTGA